MFTLKNRSLSHRILCGLLLAVFSLALGSCRAPLYYYSQYQFANRPIPPSGLQQRVLVGYSISGQSIGGLEILDGKRDIRSNVQNTIHQFTISGFGLGLPAPIFNFPAELRGYVLSAPSGQVSAINYGTESDLGATPVPVNSTVAIPSTFDRIYAASEQNGTITIVDDINVGYNPPQNVTYVLNLPGAFQVAVNPGDSVALAFVRDSNTIYRIVKLNPNQAPPPGEVDCQPYVLPVYCVVPVNGTFDHPTGAYFSLDGTQAYILDSGPEVGGQTAGVTFVQLAPLNIINPPTTVPDVSPVLSTLAVPGGVTAALSNGTTLYVSGQQKQPDGLWAGNLTTIDLGSHAITGTYSISDGNHSKMLFADDNTLWIGSQLCANGERAKLGENYNCLTRFDLGTHAVSIVPAVTPGGSVTVPYPNQNEDQYYYGSLTGLCWVQNFHKVYTAYGGQVHAFNTVDGSEIDNFYITVQGTALDVAYMDAITDGDN